MQLGCCVCDLLQLQQRQIEEEEEVLLGDGTQPDDTGVGEDMDDGQAGTPGLERVTPLEAEISEPDPWELAGRYDAS